MKKINYNRPRGIPRVIINQAVEYFKNNIPNWERKYEVIYSYHCQGDFCKRFKEIVYLED